ncbi:hypothetical protein COHA_004856 [Chlorella ohadii]|uniref:Amino acid transporter transmembrane domain-containing protein n=1 Tax=Chlorella ohadii TaxID=2649997 RepID=A0AAD5H2I2_9CHLO|nr:hypothetical protein COHA_004856 [Chlorella ohadii]
MPADVGSGAAADGGAGGGGALSQPLLQGDRNDGQGSQGSLRTGLREQKGQAARVFANLTNSGIGSSTVAMPMAVKTLGVGVAVGAMLLQGTLGVIANHILSREGERADADSYHDLMRSRFGKWGGRAVALAQMLNSLGKCVVWLIILADLIVGSGCIPAEPVLIGCLSMRSLDKLSGISLVGDAAVALMTTVALVLTVVAGRQGKAHDIHWLPSAEEAGTHSKAGLFLEVASVFPVMMGAAFTQNNISSVMHQLRPFNQPVLDATQAAARAITIAVFLCIGVANYAVFGGKLQVEWASSIGIADYAVFTTKLQPDVLLNYSGHGLRRLMPRRPALALAVAVKLSFLVNGLFTLPAYLYPYQHNLWAALPRQSPEHRMNDQRSFAATNIASLAGCTLIAVLVPSIWKPLKLLGGTAVGCMAFVFPGAIALSTRWPRHGEAHTARDRAIWALGWVLVAVGLLQAVASIASQFI